jgi:hypothetical protein
MTLKRTRLSEMLIDGLLRLEHQRTLRFRCCGLSGKFRGQTDLTLWGTRTSLGFKRKFALATRFHWVVTEQVPLPVYVR